MTTWSTALPAVPVPVPVCAALERRFSPPELLLLLVVVVVVLLFLLLLLLEVLEVVVSRSPGTPWHESSSSSTS